ncbi:MAG: antitoxin Xre/MbcA/ParS toxin-binding domain-containing protein [Myxococcales bacterium]
MKREPLLVPDRKPQAEAVVAKALVRAAQRLALSQAEMADVLGTSAASVSRTFAGERPVMPESAEGRHALLLLRLFRSLDTLVGGDEGKARRWLEAPNAHLGGHAPRALIASTPGLLRVAEYLDAMRGTL